MVEKAYETASATKGNERATSKSDPPMGGPMMRTAAARPLWAPAASGSCSVGTTARIAPGWAAPKMAVPVPSTKAMHGDDPEGRVEGDQDTARVPMAAARMASAAIMSVRRLKWSAATPAGMESTARGRVRANETSPALTAEWVRARASNG